MEYLERTKISSETETTGERIWMNRSKPTFYKGHELESYEMEMMFRESKRRWIIKIDTFEDCTSHIIVLRTKF